MSPHRRFFDFTRCSQISTSFKVLTRKGGNMTGNLPWRCSAPPALWHWWCVGVDACFVRRAAPSCSAHTAAGCATGGAGCATCGARPVERSLEGLMGRWGINSNSILGVPRVFMTYDDDYVPPQIQNHKTDSQLFLPNCLSLAYFFSLIQLLSLSCIRAAQKIK